ncbi:hypothetical protein TRVL_09097 [Trypanosoma vivax]|nr:hypothetical protein TRVL_09097 [Trypanosoma vivax]
MSRCVGWRDGRRYVSHLLVQLFLNSKTGVSVYVCFSQHCSALRGAVEICWGIYVAEGIVCVGAPATCAVCVFSQFAWRDHPRAVSLSPQQYVRRLIPARVAGT